MFNFQKILPFQNYINNHDRCQICHNVHGVKFYPYHDLTNTSPIIAYVDETLKMTKQVVVNC